MRISDWSSDVCSSDLGKPRSASPAPIAARQPLDQPSYERDQYAPKIERTDRRRPRQAARAELFPIFAPCPHGLEEALAAEMQALGFDDAQPARAGRSDERRVGKECVRTVRFRWSPYP